MLALREILALLVLLAQLDLQGQQGLIQRLSGLLDLRAHKVMLARPAHRERKVFKVFKAFRVYKEIRDQQVLQVLRAYKAI